MTSEFYRNAIKKYGIIQSMNNASGKFHDNAHCENTYLKIPHQFGITGESALQMED